MIRIILCLLVLFVCHTFVTLNGMAATAPAQAPGVKTYDQKPGKLIVYWAAIPGATDYRLTIDDGTPRDIISTATLLTVTGIKPNTPTIFTVKARNSGVEGPAGSASFSQSIDPPTEPVNQFSYITTKDGRIALRWTPVARASLYRITLEDLSNPSKPTKLWVTGWNGLLVGVLSLSAEGATLDSLLSTGTYRFTIRPGNAGGFGPTNTFDTDFTATSKPIMAPLLTVTKLNTTSATASWNVVPSATYYQLYMGTNQTTLLSGTPIFLTGNSYTYTVLDPSTLYYMAVVGLNNRGAGPASSLMNFQGTQPPQQPTPIVSSSSAPIVTWVTDPNAARYTATITIGTGSPSVVDPATSPMTLGGLPADTQGSVVITAINTVSAVASTPVLFSTPPAPPVISAVVGAGRVTVNWSPIPGVASYTLYRNQGTSAAHATALSTTNTLLTDTKLSASTPYTYVVTGRIGTLETADSNSLTVTPGITGISRLYNGTFGNAAAELYNEESGISADGRFGLFLSAATNLTDQFGSGTRLWVYDQDLGTVDVVGPIGLLAGGKGRNAIVPNGSVVAFQSNDPSIIFDDTNNATDVFVSDFSTGELFRASVDENGQQIPGPSSNAYVTDDGQQILFGTTGLGGGMKPYIYDRSMFTSQPAFITLYGFPGTGTPCGLSKLGNKIAAMTTVLSVNQQLDPSFPVSSFQQVYVRDVIEGLTRGESASSDPDRNGGVSGSPSSANVTACALSADGNWLIFQSAGSNLVANDTNAKQDVFLRNLLTGVTQRVSLASGGAQLTDDAQLVLVTENATKVIFKTKAQVVSTIPAGTLRYYQWTQDGTVIHLGIPGQSSAPAHLAMSRDGSTIGYETNAALLPADTNNVNDVYLNVAP